MKSVLHTLAAVLVVQLSLMTPAMGGTMAGGGAPGHPSPGELGGEHASALPHAHHHGRTPAGDPHDRDAAPGDHDAPPHHDHDQHCPACAIAKAAALPEPTLFPVFIALSYTPAAPRSDRASPRRTAGPPVGLRAPPLTV